MFLSHLNKFLLLYSEYRNRLLYGTLNNLIVILISLSDHKWCSLFNFTFFLLFAVLSFNLLLILKRSDTLSFFNLELNAASYDKSKKYNCTKNHKNPNKALCYRFQTLD